MKENIPYLYLMLGSNVKIPDILEIYKKDNKRF
jgi:hypothetical protein